MKLPIPLLTLLTLTAFHAIAQNPAAPASVPKIQEPVPPSSKAAVVRNVGPAEFDSLRGRTNTVILDVRSTAEYADGHLPGARLVDFRSPTFEKQVAELDRSKLYLVHCAGGVRSAKACVKMINLGFTNVVNLEGGLSAWSEAGKPLEK